MAYCRIIILPLEKENLQLITAYKTIIALERQTFGLDDSGSSDADNLGLFLKEIRKRNKPMVNDDERK